MDSEEDWKPDNQWNASNPFYKKHERIAWAKLDKKPTYEMTEKDREATFSAWQNINMRSISPRLKSGEWELVISRPEK